MSDIQKIISSINIPKKYEREITFMLYNYKNINKLIEKRKEDLIDNINVTNSNWLKCINGETNTLENIIISFDSDKNILRLKKWKILINSFLNKLYDYENPKYFIFIKSKYFNRLDEEILEEKFDMNENELREMDIFLKNKIYLLAQRRELY